MAKPAKPAAEPEAPQISGTSRPPVQCDVTPATWERCRKDLHVKLVRAVTNSHESGDTGRISQIVADIRALDLVEPVKGDALKSTGQTLPDGTPVTTPEHRRQLAEIEERKAAASDPEKMRAFNAKITAKETIFAQKEETGA